MCVNTFVVLFALVSSCLAGQDWPGREEELDWWQKGVMYNFNTRAFKDSDGDGIGDLNGIRSSIDYLYSLDVAAVWLYPISKSPMKDYGFDISDYRSIDPIFGTFDDFKALVSEMSRKGLKIIMGFVPNHSSDQHDWFQRSIKREDPYTNYYVWADPKIGEDGSLKPPNNWLDESAGGSAWEYNEKRGQYYLHQIGRNQPDLNYTNELVVKEILDILDFWMELGVYGFKLDLANFLFEADGFPDEPRDEESGVDDPNNYGYLKHIYTKDDPRCYGVIARIRERLDAYSQKTDNVTRILIADVFTNIETAMKYYGNETVPGSHMITNFELSKDFGRWAKNFSNAVSLCMDNLPKGKSPNWMVGTHDVYRVGTRYAPELIDAMNMLIMLLPGTAVTYYGEEIGMLNTYVSWEDTKDPMGCNVGPDHYKKKSRDQERTPFQWKNAPLAGFTDGNSTWLPVNPNYVTVNVADEELNSISHLNIYKQLVSIRETPTVQKGDLSIRTIGDKLFAFRRLYTDEEGLLVLMNLGTNTLEEINLKESFDNLPSEATVKLGSTFSVLIPGDVVETEKISLMPNEGLVLGIGGV